MRRLGFTAPLAGAAALFAGCSMPSPVAESAAQERRVETVGLDPAGVDALLAEAETLPRLNAMIVARDGEAIVERVFRGPALDRPVNIKSASKTVLSAVVGIAIGRGVLDGADQRIAPILSDKLPPNPDPRIRDISVGDLLSMRAGLGSTSGGNYGRWVSSNDWVRTALARPFEDDPGGRMIYSTGTSHLMSAVLTRAAGRSTLALTRDWLGEPLGIAIPEWPADPQGIYFGGNDMLMSPRALLAFGELYRNGGMAGGTQVIPADWIEDSWRSRGTSPWSGNGYGYGWFTKDSGGHPVHFAWGYGGQMLFIVPTLDLTVVMTSDPSPRARDDHVRRLHELLDRYIVPAAERGDNRQPATGASPA